MRTPFKSVEGAAIRLAQDAASRTRLRMAAEALPVGYLLGKAGVESSSVGEVVRDLLSGVGAYAVLARLDSLGVRRSTAEARDAIAAAGTDLETISRKIPREEREEQLRYLQQNGKNYHLLKSESGSLVLYPKNGHTLFVLIPDKHEVRYILKAELAAHNARRGF